MPLNPLLAPLGSYGGPTQTMALLPGSAAIGAGTAVSGITTDQRGVARPANGSDIGAFQSPDLWPQLFSNVNCIALWISSENILTRLYSVLHWFHKRLEVNVKNPRENRCFQTIIVFSFGSVDNSNTCTVLFKIAARLITVSTSVNN